MDVHGRGGLHRPDLGPQVWAPGGSSLLPGWVGRGPARETVYAGDFLKAGEESR